MPLDKTPTVAIVVLNWHNAADTIACLHSLAKVSYPHHVVVVDNASTDDSVAQLRAVFPSLDLLITPRNLGYAGGNNVGIKHALESGADYLLILNNDVIVSADFLDQLVTTAQLTNAAVCTPLIAGYHPHDNVVWALGARINWDTGNIERLHTEEAVEFARKHTPEPIDIAPGSAMLVAASAFQQIGLFDETYFLYFEEAEWCLRVRERGLMLVTAPQAVVYHIVSGTLGQQSPITEYYMTRNQLRFIQHHQHGWNRLRLLLTVGIRQLYTVLAYSLKQRKEEARAYRAQLRLQALYAGITQQSGMMSPAIDQLCQKITKITRG